MPEKAIEKNFRMEWAMPKGKQLPYKEAKEANEKMLRAILDCDQTPPKAFFTK